MGWFRDQLENLLNVGKNTVFTPTVFTHLCKPNSPRPLRGRSVQLCILFDEFFDECMFIVATKFFEIYTSNLNFRF